jgi:hypothetical protein
LLVQTRIDEKQGGARAPITSPARFNLASACNFLVSSFCTPSLFFDDMDYISASTQKDQLPSIRNYKGFLGSIQVRQHNINGDAVGTVVSILDV